MQPALAEAQLLAMQPISALPGPVELGENVPAHDVWAAVRSAAKPASEVCKLVRNEE